jgi:hypothetical protein
VDSWSLSDHLDLVVTAGISNLLPLSHLRGLVAQVGIVPLFASPQLGDGSNSERIIDTALLGNPNAGVDDALLFGELTFRWSSGCAPPLLPLPIAVPQLAETLGSGILVGLGG